MTEHVQRMQLGMTALGWIIDDVVGRFAHVAQEDIAVKPHAVFPLSAAAAYPVGRVPPPVTGVDCGVAPNLPGTRRVAALRELEPGCVEVW